ncbi:MAG: GNAT family N-acetyltransferase [Oscillospiraceae bacterium]|nr:GNAT family N-acetyltransferase [Oscillospiraceae bacterium]
MKIVSYFESDQKDALMDKIGQCDWSAATFLCSLLKNGTFFETLGGFGDLYLLMDGENLVSFATLTGQDAVRDESLYPWIGFVFTVPEYRGHRHAGSLLAYAESIAASQGHSRVYIATDHIGLYEKYGYSYQENRIDCWGDNMRVLYQDLEDKA